jgi:hypothetical protein
MKIIIKACKKKKKKTQSETGILSFNLIFCLGKNCQPLKESNLVKPAHENQIK